MEKEDFIKKLTLILEEFDSNREVDMKYYLDDIYSASEIYFADVIKIERKKAVIDFLSEQFKSLNR